MGLSMVAVEVGFEESWCRFRGNPKTKKPGFVESGTGNQNPESGNRNTQIKEPELSKNAKTI